MYEELRALAGTWRQRAFVLPIEQYRACRVLLLQCAEDLEAAIHRAEVATLQDAHGDSGR